MMISNIALDCDSDDYCSDCKYHLYSGECELGGNCDGDDYVAWNVSEVRNPNEEKTNR